MRKLPLLFLCAGYGASMSLPVHADIVAVGGDVVLADPPPNISNGQWRSNTEIRGWFERQATLPSAVPLDHAPSGRVELTAQLVGGAIPAGTQVQSYMVRFDPASGGVHSLTGFVLFDTPILGVILDRGTLNASDDLFGRPGVQYNTNNNRGMEMGPTDGTDWFEISEDRLRIDFYMIVTNGPTDDIRILTAVPAPGAALPLAASLMLAARRRR